MFQRGAHAAAPTELVLAPVALHRRTLKRRFEDAGQPRAAIRLAPPVTVARELLDQATPEGTHAIVDRVDRVRVLERLLETSVDGTERLRRCLGGSPVSAIQSVEQARTEVESLTGYHPERLAAVRIYYEHHDSVAASDLADLVEGTVAIERELRAATDRAPSKATLLRAACRALRDSGGSVWEATYASIDRLWLCGLSTFSASLVDLVATIDRETDVAVHLYARPATGQVLRERLAETVAVDDPGAEVFDDG